MYILFRLGCEISRLIYDGSVSFYTKIVQLQPVLCTTLAGFSTGTTAVTVKRHSE